MTEFCWERKSDLRVGEEAGGIQGRVLQRHNRIPFRADAEKRMQNLPTFMNYALLLVNVTIASIVIPS